jgi:peptidoglycan/xylan/chitin deacetylase (PgdA/CDA1 family)
MGVFRFILVNELRFMVSISCLTFDDVSPTFVSSSRLEKLLNFLNSFDVQCTFFVVPFGYEKWSERYVEFLNQIKDSGHELALHGYKHIDNEFGYYKSIPFPSFFPLPRFKTQKERIQESLRLFAKLTGVKPTGFRAPYYLHNNATFEVLSELGFRYDSSKTIFKPTHGLNLKMRWLINVKPFFKLGVMEIPVTGDYTFDLNEYTFVSAINAALRDFKWIMSRGGVFVLNNHSQRLNEYGFQFLKRLLKKLKEEAIFLKLTDVPEAYCQASESCF